MTDNVVKYGPTVLLSTETLRGVPFALVSVQPGPQSVEDRTEVDAPELWLAWDDYEQDQPVLLGVYRTRDAAMAAAELAAQRDKYGCYYIEGSHFDA